MIIPITDKDYDYKMAVLTALHEVMDPELNVNIVDLGLVYDLHIDDAEKMVTVVMTLSTPACPLGGIISAHVKVAVTQVLPAYDATVNLVWDPRWNADMVSESGKRLLGW